MINKPKGYDEVQAYTDQEKLPPGGYVLKILDTKLATYTWGDVMIIRFDIAEGEQSGFFQKNFDAQTQEDKKWKGTFRINLPKDDGTEQDGWTMRTLKTNMLAIEDSNNGYAWDWDETKLKNKLVGGLFGNIEYNFNGKNGFYVGCRKFTSVEKVRNGDFKIPENKLLKKDDDSGIPEGFEAVTDESIPF